MPKNSHCRGGRRRSWSKKSDAPVPLRNPTSQNRDLAGDLGLGRRHRQIILHVHWPLRSEIATQYILLLLVEMKQSCMLKLPYRASEIVRPRWPDYFPLPNTRHSGDCH